MRLLFAAPTNLPIECGPVHADGITWRPRAESSATFPSDVYGVDDELTEPAPVTVTDPELETLAESVKLTKRKPRMLFAEFVMARLWDARAGTPRPSP